MPTITQQKLTLGGGCFWCLDAAYRQVKGVLHSTCGYSGGEVPNPTYEEVSTGATGHAEVVQLTYEPQHITLDQLLEIFWILHDPTSVDRQGNDVGPQYRSIILYENESQKKSAVISRDKAQKLWDKPIVTEITALQAFYPAEEEHQNFFAKHPEYGYCQVIINPKIHKLQQKFASLLQKP